MNVETLRLLVAKGLTAEDILEVAEAMAVKTDPTAAERQARYRARKAERDSVTRDVTRDDVTEAPLSRPLSPQTPQTPTHTPGITTRARKGPVGLAVRPDEVSEAVWDDFTGQRKKPFTDTALRGLKREADKAGWSLEAAIEESTLRGWEGFKADWVKGKQNGQRSQLPRPTTRQLGERAAARLAGANDCAPDGLPRLGAPGGYG